MSRRIRTPALCAAIAAMALWLPFPCSAAGDSASAAVVELVDGSTASGTNFAVSADSASLSINRRDAKFSVADVVGVEFSGEAARSSSAWWVQLSNGDRLPVERFDLVDEHLVVRPVSGREAPMWRVPLELVSALLRRTPAQETESPLLSELSRRAFDDDTLILRDGTRLVGSLEGAGGGSLRVETAVGPVDVDLERVAGVAMNAALIQQPPVRDGQALATLHDGTWLTLHGLTVAHGEILGRTGFDAEWRAPLTDVSRLAFYGPRVADLTLRKPLEEVVEPFVSRRARMLANRNVRGGWLQLDDRAYARGFGMTSGMRVTFPLEPGDRQFRATVGIDESAGDAGSVVFGVDLDGRRLYDSPMLTGRDEPVIVGPLDVSGGARLTLSVEFAEQGHVADVADWCDPVLLR